MITIYRKEGINTKNNEQELEIRCLSTDTKPTALNNKPISNGTTLIEMNTGKIYLYDAENEQWREM